MTTAWQQVLQQVTTLNDPNAPFSYHVTPEGAIVGFWDVAKIEMQGLAGSSTFDKEYRIDVTPVSDDKYSFTEKSTESSSSAGAGGISGSKSTFKGKSFEMSGGMSFGKSGRSKGEPTTAAGWSFSTEEIKRPLFDFLEQHGWKRKGGFLGGLFG